MKLNTSLIIRFIKFFDTIKLLEIAINTGFLTGLSITKNAIFKRLPAAVKLLQQCFVHALELSLKQTVPVKDALILSQFKDIKICDSTRISIPDKLANVFPGLGGRNAKASLKIQTIFSLVTNTFTKFELTPSPGPDATYNE